MSIESWKDKHILKIRDDRECRVLIKNGTEDIFQDAELVKGLKPSDLRKEIEPWLTALFQSEHLALLTGNGISAAVHEIATGGSGSGMNKITFSTFEKQIQLCSENSAKESGRGEANIEDQIRTATELLKGLEIYNSVDFFGAKKNRKKVLKFKKEISDGLIGLVANVLKSEKNIINAGEMSLSAEYLMNFLVSFASRSATRERLHIFTTNYDRVMEFGAELAGIRLMDRFVGSINPIFRSSRLEIDMHYNPPGIRGEPRYLEGVVNFTKLHGSLDWIYQNKNVRRIALPFGAESIAAYLPVTQDGVDAQSLMIYPNAAKDRETAEYPYVELFRDLAAAICRPNATVVVYGYSFGDDHINRIIKDMLTIPSTHLVIIAWNDEGGRIKHFYDSAHRPAQMSVFLGTHFGSLKNLVEYYLPKPAIDRTTFKMAELLRSRGIIQSGEGSQKGENHEPKSN